MGKHKAKIHSLPVAVVIAASLMSGCGSGIGAPNDTAVSSTARPASAAGAAIATDTGNLPDSIIDDTSPITFDWYVDAGWFAAKWGQDSTSRYITSKTGVSINFITPAGSDVKKQLMVASGDIPDFVSFGFCVNEVKQLINGGLVISVNELAQKYDPRNSGCNSKVGPELVYTARRPVLPASQLQLSP